jgi:hypothetical protein
MYPTLAPSTSTTVIEPIFDEQDSSDEEEEEKVEPTYLSDYGVYTCKIYGFRVSVHSKSGPRMYWLRKREE